ncbi:MAG: hypothetical protein ACLRWQ_21985 [Flavonifractor plautii]
MGELLPGRRAGAVRHRYTTSNAVHQASKLPEAEWEGFFRWLFDFECGKLGLPRPGSGGLSGHAHGAGRWSCSARREDATHTKGDIHEVDTDYLAPAAGAPPCRPADCLGWRKVPCVDGRARCRSHRGHPPTDLGDRGQPRMV